MSQFQTLNYAPRRVITRKRVLRSVLIIVVIAAVSVAYYFRKDIWNRSRLIYFAYQCEKYSVAADTIAYADDADQFKQSPYTGENFYRCRNAGRDSTFNRSTRTHVLVHYPVCYENMVSVVGTYRPYPVTKYPDAIVYLGQLSSRSGHTRLVSVQFFIGWLVFDSNNHLQFGYRATTWPPSKLGRFNSNPVQTSGHVVVGIDISKPGIIYAGQPDPADASHFTIRYQMWGQDDVLDGWLRDDDTVSLVARKSPKEPLPK